MALWAPDIEPPPHWLVPAILYQDKIATFAPEAHLDERDGQVARRMERTLGDLYEQVSILATFQGNEFALEELRSRLPGWIELARRNDPHETSYVARWSERALNFNSRRTRNAGRIRQIDDARRRLEGSVRTLQSRLSELGARLHLTKQELEALKVAATPGNEAAKAARKAAVEPIVERMRPMLHRRSALDRRSEEFMNVSFHIDHLRNEIREARQAHSNPRNAAMEEKEREVGALRLQIDHLRQELAPLTGELDRLSRERERIREWLATPYGENDRWALDRGFRASDLWGLPPELDTIAVGKVYGRLFEFLATEGGLWVATRPDRPYAGTLVGPRFVIEDVMMILARHVSERRSDLVLMTGNDRSETLRRSFGLANSVATVSWLLPVPRTTDLTAVRIFRERHDAELGDLRKHLRHPIHSAETPQELEDALRHIEENCKEASREISRALELDRRVGLKHIRGSIVSEVGSTLSDFATAATLGSIPVLSSTLSAGDATSGIPLGLVVAGATLTGRTALDSWRAYSARKRIATPFLYSYEAIRQLES